MTEGARNGASPATSAARSRCPSACPEVLFVHGFQVHDLRLRSVVSPERGARPAADLDRHAEMLSNSTKGQPDVAQSVSDYRAALTSTLRTYDILASAQTLSESLQDVHNRGNESFQAHNSRPEHVGNTDAMTSQLARVLHYAYELKPQLSTLSEEALLNGALPPQLLSWVRTSGTG